MTTLQRAAVAAAVLFLGVAVWALFIPAHSHGTSCGTWLSPRLTDAGVARQVQQTQQVVDDSNALGLDTTRLQITTAALVAVKGECDSKLSTRKTISWVALAGLLVVPLAILFVGGGLTPRKTTDAPET